jgi:hypothetical protein
MAPKSRAPKTISNVKFTTRLPKLHSLAALPPVFKCYRLVDEKVAKLPKDAVWANMW